MVIAVKGLMPLGKGTNQSALMRWRCAKPPQWRSPTPQPVRTTASPALKRGLLDSITVPAESMPGTMGNWRMIFPVPVTAIASL